MNDNLLLDISAITRNRDNFKPHKYLAILSVIRLFDVPSLRRKEIYYDDKFRSIFTELFNKYASENDRNRPYAPFFHLRSHAFWSLRAIAGKEKELDSVSSVGGPALLNEMVECAILSDELYAALLNDEERLILEKHIVHILNTNKSVSAFPQVTGSINSAFVLYINSLHCIDANSDGALAEAQAKNPFFHGIHVKHPWASIFAKKLTDSSSFSHIILSGHAGDGKSTIALELYKILMHIENQEFLPSGLAKRTDVEPNITIIKDLSEWTDKEQDSLFAEMVSNVRRFVLVSNTGCLLNVFKRHATLLQKMSIEVEDELLTQLDVAAGKSWKTESGVFEIFNLARLNNIDAALEMFRLLIASPQWNNCEGCSLHPQCPIFRNIRIIRQYKERIIGRMRLLLLRTLEYGSRLTMRQLSAHFAYMITSGLDCEKIADSLQKKHVFSMEQYLFSNRFWGDNGWQPDVNAAQLKSTRVVDEQRFGSVYAPSMERLIWLRSDTLSFDLGIPEIEPILKRLLEIAVKAEDDENVESRAAARTQVRRLVFFFYDKPAHQHQINLFLNAFVNSPMLCEYLAWLDDPIAFSRRRNTLKDQLFQVLQEQFSGIKSQDGVINDRILYITLNRRQHNIRQSSQIMLGKIDFSDSFDIRVQPIGEKKAVMLFGKNGFDSIQMILELPFLDYIFVRKSGGIGSILQVAYTDRLENVKAEMLRSCIQVQEEELLLLKLDMKNVLRRQRLTLTGTTLEVTNG
jgi:hypothetical protein